MKLVNYEVFKSLTKDTEALVAVVGAVLTGIFLLFHVVKELGLVKGIAVVFFNVAAGVALGLSSPTIAKWVRKISAKRVYISYPHENESVASDIASTVRGAGYTVWIGSERLMPGMNLRSEIENAIKNSSVFIPLISRSTSFSRWSGMELGMALSVRGLKIIPIILDDAEIPSGLDEIYFIDASSNMADAKCNLLKAIS